MTIKKAIQGYYSSQTNPLSLFLDQARLNADLKNTFVNQSGGWAFFGKLISIRYNYIADENSRFHPDHVIKLCSELGLNDFEALSRFAQTFDSINCDGFLEIFGDNDLNLPASELKKYSATDMAVVIGNIIHIDPEITDSEYLVPAESKLPYIVSSCPSNRFAYLPEKRDCDDFVRIMRGWLSEQGYGNVTIGYCEYEALDVSKNFLFAHAVAIAVIYNDSGLSIRLIEPQRDNMIYSIENPQGMFSNVSNIKIRKVIL